MPYIKSLSVHADVKSSIVYILNPEKTEDTLYTASLNCLTNAEDAYLNMKMIYEHYSCRKYNEPPPLTGKAWVKAIHYIQSFDPKDNISPALAHKIAKAFARKTFGDNCQIVIATHCDKSHIHNHFILNSYGIDGQKFYANKNSLDRIKEYSDRVCLAFGVQPYDKSKGKINYIGFSDLISMRDRSNEQNEEFQIREFVSFLFHYYSLYTKIEMGSDEWAEKSNAIDEHIEDYFLEEKRHSAMIHYKNLMLKNEQSDFENVLELLSNQLKRYDVNLYYCKKILDFFDKYYPDEIFPQDTFFLNNYLGNTVDLMILTISKLYLDACDVKKRKNCGIKYLQSFIGIKVSDKSNIKDILKKASAKIKEVVSIAEKLEPVRDKLIAHFDISDIETAQNVKMHI